jgi:hypothetical protein
MPRLDARPRTRGAPSRASEECCGALGRASKGGPPDRRVPSRRASLAANRFFVSTGAADRPSGRSRPLLRPLIRDRDKIFGAVLDRRVENLGLTQLRIAPRRPWQNGFAERWVGTARREIVDHVIVLGEHHLRRILREYVGYYNADRPHMSLRGDAPMRRKGPAAIDGPCRRAADVCEPLCRTASCWRSTRFSATRLARGPSGFPGKHVFRHHMAHSRYQDAPELAWRFPRHPGLV